MTQIMEKLSVQDKAKLSRETILEWYKAKNREKLEDLKEEILTLAHTDREKLRGIIIENTKRELEKHKSLTAEQREVQAKQFADELIKAIVAKESIESVMKRYESMMRLGGPNALKNRWMENNPGSKIETGIDDPKYLALREIPESLGEIKNEAVGLLYMFEKFIGTRKQALEIYDKCWKNDKFNIDFLRKEFTKEKTKGKTGFFYGTKIVVWRPEFLTKWSTVTNSIKAAGFDYETYSWTTSDARKVAKVKIKGWWAHDIDEEWTPDLVKRPLTGNLSVNERTDFKGGSNFTKEVLSKFSTDNKSGGYGDEFLGRTFKDAMTNLHKELKPEEDKNERDSGLSPRKEGEVLMAATYIKDNLSSGVVYKEESQKLLYNWLSKNAINKWVKLEEKEIGLMTFLFGRGSNNYLYRYSPKKNEVYAMRIDGSNVEKGHFGARIFIKNNALHSWESFNKENTEKMLSYVSENMTPQEISAELLDYRIKDQAPEKVSSQDKLDVTRGIAGSVFGLKNVEYENIQTGYVDKLTEKLKETLVAKGMDKDKTQEYADLRASNVKDEIHKIIEADEVLNKACKDDSKVKLEIKVDSNDQVAVRLTDRNLEKKLKRDIDKKSEDDNSPEAVEGGIMKQIVGWVEKYAGRFTGLVMVAMEKVFKISDKVKEYAKGTPTYMGAFLSFLGFKSSKDLVSTKRIKEKAFEKLPPANKRSYSLTKKMIFEEDITLKNKKIIIPKGKGFIPGGKMKLLLDSRYPAEFDPDKTGAELKGKKDIKSIFNTLKKSKEQYKDHEITIESGTVVPHKTEIPKGSRIERV